jgi:L-amino acid N-acyltransferase YncA
MAEDQVRIVTVDAGNVADEGFFCYKSKRKSEGYATKSAWLEAAFGAGLTLKILYEGKRSVGFVEYIPGEFTWRAVDAPGYLVIHCLWVVGRGKKKGYGTRLLHECIRDAKRQGKHGVVMVSSRGTWLAHEKLFLKNGFTEVGSAPAPFSLLVLKLGDAPDPTMPDDWGDRLAALGPGATILYADQCPYMPDVVTHAQGELAARGIEAMAIKLETPAEARAKSPTPYGVFAIVIDGRLLSYTYLGKRELRRLDEEFVAGGDAPG